MNTRIKDAAGKDKTYTLGFRIEYDYLNYTDLRWIVDDVVRESIKELIHQNKEISGIQLKGTRDVAVVINSASTKHSILIDFAFIYTPHLNRETLELLGALAWILYDYIKRRSRDGAYMTRRRTNLTKVWVCKREIQCGRDGTFYQEEILGETVESEEIEIHR